MSWKIHGNGSDIIEVWEDFYGNLWFVAEETEDEGIYYGYARLYHMPDMAEWGYFSWNEIVEAVGQYKVWKVDKKNWCNINTYEDNLLVEVD